MINVKKVKRKLQKPEPVKLDLLFSQKIQGNGVASAGPFPNRGSFVDNPALLPDNGFNLTQKMVTVNSNITTRVSNVKTPLSPFGVLENINNNFIEQKGEVTLMETFSQKSKSYKK